MENLKVSEAIAAMTEFRNEVAVFRMKFSALIPHVQRDVKTPAISEVVDELIEMNKRLDKYFG